VATVKLRALVLVFLALTLAACGTGQSISPTTTQNGVPPTPDGGA